METIAQKEAAEGDPWTLTIESKKSFFDLRVRELAHYWDLVWLFVKRDFTTAYKQTILGPLWFIINPLFSTVIYTFVFGNLAHLGTDGIPYLLFYYGGTMLWTYFSSCFTDASNIFSNNAGLFSKVYFPRLTVPIARIFNNLITLTVQFVTLMIFYGYYLVKGEPLRPGWTALLFPLLFAWIALLATGMGMLVSALTTKYKDLKQLVSFALHLAMYATPIVYPLSEAPERFKWFFYINPMSAPVELFRVWFYGAGTATMPMVLSSLIMTAFFTLAGLVMFNRNERTFVDII
jgi:lipopolysaccharide transport system permease protein